MVIDVNPHLSVGMQSIEVFERLFLLPQLNLLLGAIHPDYQNRGLDKMMGNAFLRSAMKDGKEYMDSHLEMETNTKVRAEMEHAGGEVYKRYRIFHKSC